MLSAHFTFVFGCSGIPREMFRKEIESVAGRSAPIAFVLRDAAASEHAGSHYVYLCPREGAGRMRGLYDRLHAGRLSAALDVRQPFVPHMTVCRTAERAEALAVCDRMNGDGLCIRGALRGLGLGAQGDAFQLFAHAPLAGAT
jgi:2'-5' RNA ligase